MSKILAYIRSTDHQDASDQKSVIIKYLKNKGFPPIDELMEVSRPTKHDIKTLLARLETENTLVTSNLSRLGRNLTQVVALVGKLVNKGVRVIAVKEGINIQDGNAYLPVQMLADIEEDFTRQRRKEGIGRPPGSTRIRRSVLDDREAEIKELLRKRVPKASIAKIMDVSYYCANSFISSRGLTGDQS